MTGRTPARGGGCLRLLLTALLAFGWLLAAPPAQAQADAPRIGVATMAPGEIFFERFGHNAIVVADPRTGAATAYNFGFFDPTEPDFLARFVEGRMRYRLAALPFAEDLAYYRQVGRGVTVQWLDLTPDQARELAQALRINALPQNAHYDYQYFDDNCATRVRDALDRALDGALKRQTAGRSHGNTYRGEALRLSRPVWWMWLGFDLGLGPAADAPRSVWEDAFVPMRLADALAETRTAAGGPLVVATERVLPHRLAPEPGERPIRWMPWAAAGVALAAALLLAARRAPRALGAFALVWWTLCTLIGAMLLFLWVGTEHRYAWANRNLLLFLPLCALLLPAAWRRLRARAPRRWERTALAVVAGIATLALFFYWLPKVPQQNLHWIVLTLPVHAALALAWPRAARRTG